MKRRTVAVWILALVLSLGTATLSAMAAEGWKQESNGWVYLDSHGDRVYNAWKKGADNLWRYLDGDGVMATNCWVDTDYYVDGDGIMYTEKWLKVTNDEGEYEWYYFGSSGKAIKDTWKKINDKWYHFDDDGKLEVGWILDDMYYCGEDGVMRTGWQKLYPPDGDDYDSNRVTPSFDSLDDDDGRNWYYFSSSGKKYVPDDDSGDYGARKIEGTYYCFDQDGAMQTGWKNVRSGSSDSIEDYMYFGSDGKAKIGWYSIEPPEDLEGYDGDVEWFYFSNSGKPRAADSDRLTVNDLWKVNGRSYLFNNKGNPVHGLKKVYTGGDSWTAFYFGDKNTSNVQKGKMKITEGDGSRSDFYFADNGRGYTGVKDNHLYYAGKLQEATDGSKYMCYRVNGNNYVVNSSGKIMKNSNVKNSDGVKFTTSSSGTLQKADDDTDIDGYVNDPVEPVWDED